MIKSLSILTFLVVSTFCPGQSSSSTNFDISTASIDGGGGAASSPNYRIQASRIGGFVGVSGSANFESKSGFVPQVSQSLTIDLCDFISWARQFFSRNQANSQPDDDFDGDGLSNEEEFLALTDPTDSNSRFKLFITQVGTELAIHFSPRATSDLRTYTLLGGDTLANQLTPTAAISAPTGEGGVFLFDPQPTDFTQFFQVQVSKAE